MKAYRIEREKYLKTALSGIGASKPESFRWNSLNTRLVYTAESRALATLEIAVHLDLSEDLPTDRFYVEIDIPKHIPIAEVSINDLPKNWDAHPASIRTQIIGDDFVNQNTTAVLKVPSSIVSQEFNFLINPNHPDIKRIKVISQIPMDLDNRFKAKK
jgi:RES domain-containing protein